MTTEPFIHFPPPTGSDAELHQPAVIIDMPEIGDYLRRRKMVRVLKRLGLALLFLALLGLVSFEVVALLKDTAVSSDAPVVARRIVLTVNVFPPEAAVKLDGVALEGTPPSIELEADDVFRSIEIAANGYESLTRDVRLQDTQLIKVKLRRLDVPTPGGIATEPDAVDDADNEIVFEVESPQVAAGPKEALPRKNKLASATPTPRKTAADRPSPDVPTVSEPPAPSPPRQPVADAAGASPAAPPPPPAAPPAAVAPPPAPAPAPTPAPAAAPAEKPAPPKPATEDTPTGANAEHGTLVVRAPAGATGAIEVFIDKKRHGVAPLTVELNKGLHEVVFVSAGKRTLRMVNIRPGERRPIDAKVD
ncbi:MAG: hypothetical protein M0R76_02435 [Proteobacteria bacterium]|nr:hypothetical protein [Pseudomonadota bacterium]